MTDYAALIAGAREDTRELVQVERGEAHAIVRMCEPDRLNALSAPMPLRWDQAIAMEEFAEPMCFTTTGHREAVAELLRS